MIQKLTISIFVALFLSACASQGSPPDPNQPRRELSVGIVVVDGVYNTELTAPMDMFHHTVFHADPGMRVFLVAPTLGEIRTFEGLRLLPDFSFDTAPPIDVLVVPSAEHSMDSDLQDKALINFVSTRGRRAQWVLSLCDGAFVLAQAGLLDNRDATTFPSDRAALAQMFPLVTVHDDASFVQDGRIITSEGGARSFEPALFLCELLFGRTAAKGIAGGLVIDWNPDRIPHLVARPAPSSTLNRRVTD